MDDDYRLCDGCRSLDIAADFAKRLVSTTFDQISTVNHAGLRSLSALQRSSRDCDCCALISTGLMGKCDEEQRRALAFGPDNSRFELRYENSAYGRAMMKAVHISLHCDLVHLYISFLLGYADGTWSELARF